MRLALTDLFKARWTDAIHKEWIAALLRQEHRFTRTKLERVRDLMDQHVRDAKVEGYEALKNPPKSKDEFLVILQKQQLPQTVAALKDYIDLI